jgi:type VI secretion system secreted protein Hcp
MPIPAYAFFKDDGGGDIAGSVEISGREGAVEVLEFDHKVYIPTDPTNGKLKGVRKHEVFEIVKEFDASTPYLYKACCEGQTLKEVRVSWFTIDPSGTETEYFTHTLKDVKVASIKSFMPNAKDPDKERYGHLEKVSLMYSGITWTYVDGGLEHSDAWTAER